MSQNDLIITAQDAKTTQISGNTFKHKELIRSLGGRWDATGKHWLLPTEKLQDLLASIPNVAQDAPSMQSRLRGILGDVASDPSMRDTMRALAEARAPPPARHRNPIETAVRAIVEDHAPPQSQLAPVVTTLRIPATGTFPVKDQIKAAGGRWDPATKEWIVPITFDDSIIPPLPARAPLPVRAEVAERAISPTRKRSLPHCGLCGVEGHRRDRCTFMCPYCQMVGNHLEDECPNYECPQCHQEGTHYPPAEGEKRCLGLNPRWKLMERILTLQSKDDKVGVRGDPLHVCECNRSSVCKACQLICCSHTVCVGLSPSECQNKEAYFECSKHKGMRVVLQVGHEH